MAGFEPWSSGIGSNCSANCATTTALQPLPYNHCPTTTALKTDLFTWVYFIPSWVRKAHHYHHSNAIVFRQCDQIGLFLKVLGEEIFIPKSHKFFVMLVVILKTSLSSNSCILWGGIWWKNLATLNPIILSYCPFVTSNCCRFIEASSKANKYVRKSSSLSSWVEKTVKGFKHFPGLASPLKSFAKINSTKWKEEISTKK